jgi:hypothetical protein
MSISKTSYCDSRLTCPGCAQECQGCSPGGTWVCPGCKNTFDVDSQGRLQSATLVISALLRYLDALEILGRRMIAGIGHFLASTMWEWLWKELILVSRIVVKAARVLAVFACWSAISFGPLLLVWRMKSSGLLLLMALAWTALALGGSLWGACYMRRQLVPSSSPGLLFFTRLRVRQFWQRMRRRRAKTA